MAKPLNFEKAALIVTTIVFTIIAVLIIALFFTPQDQFSDQPQDWIEQDVTGNTLDIQAISDGYSSYSGGKQTIPVTSDEVAALYIWGSYDGQLFSDTYYVNGQPVFRVNPQNINPNDGIPEAFAVAQLDHPFDKPVPEDQSPRPTVIAVYLYVDEDWKTQVGENMRIIWGNDVYTIDTLHERPYDYSTNENGLYYDKIDTDVDWVMQTTGEALGRVILGPVTIQDLVDGDLRQPMVILS